MNKINSLLPTFIIVSIVLFIFSCKHEPDDLKPDDPNNPGDTSDLIACDPDTAYFQNEVLPIFQSSCALSGCHDDITAEHGLIMTSYSNIMNSGHVEAGNASESEIYEAITDPDPDDRMPPPPLLPLSSDQIATIRDWINQGAGNNYCDAECDTNNFTYASAIKPIIDQTCKGCHNSALANGGVRLDSYEFIAAVANDGRLLGTISHSGGYTPMPFNGNKLDDCKITQVRKWIEAGSQNN